MNCNCGLPMSRNPHPNAGMPDESGVAAGYAYECIPCLVATRNRVGTAWREEQAKVAALTRRLQQCREQVGNVVEHCYQPKRLHCSACQNSLELVLEMLRGLAVDPNVDWSCGTYDCSKPFGHHGEHDPHMIGTNMPAHILERGA